LSALTDSLLANPLFRSAIATDESLRDIAQRFGCSFGFVQKLRASGVFEGAAVLPITKAATESKAPAEESGITADGEVYYTINRNHAVTLKDWEEWVRHGGGDPDNFIPSIRSIAYGVSLYSNRLGMTPKWKGLEGGAPKWPVIQPAAAARVTIARGNESAVRREPGVKLAMKSADYQIGYRILPDGTVLEFHDEQSMAVFVEACRLYQPDTIQILGDFLDLSEQSHFAQERAFARTTQMAFDRGHLELAKLRAVCPNARIILIEGNHDKRLQNYVEANALSAFGLKQANKPDSWPVMSIPFLLRLDDLNVQYIEAYPAATDWDNDRTRNIHGTRANSKGSTMSQYLHELSHINTWAGHTHRPEIIYRTIMGLRGEAIESYAANPGCMCKTDGSVPSVKGAIGAGGMPAKVVEDWQNGFGMLYFTETGGWPQVIRIQDGRAYVGSRVITAPFLREIDPAA
jgi:predicted phosphodiesterase